MYIDHADIKKPGDEERIWRYIDFAKFVGMLSTKTLHFARVDTLDDPFEGSFPKVNVRLRRENFKDKMPKREIRSLSDFYKEYLKHTFVNCWHINKDQSAAMWRLYIQSNEGIAIRSTFGRLKNSFTKSKSYEVYIGEIKYINYSKDVIPEGTLYPYFHKRRAFEHEHELRAVIQDFTRDKKGEIDWNKFPPKSGLNISVDLDTLIEKIVLAPNCPSWQKSVVKSILDNYELDKEVSRSILYVRDKRIVY